MRKLKESMGSIKAAGEYKLKIEEQLGANFSFEEKIEKLESIFDSNEIIL